MSLQVLRVEGYALLQLIPVPLSFPLFRQTPAGGLSGNQPPESGNGRKKMTESLNQERWKSNKPYPFWELKVDPETAVCITAGLIEPPCLFSPVSGAENRAGSFRCWQTTMDTKETPQQWISQWASCLCVTSCNEQSHFYQRSRTGRWCKNPKSASSFMALSVIAVKVLRNRQIWHLILAKEITVLKLVRLAYSRVQAHEIGTWEGKKWSSDI